MINCEQSRQEILNRQYNYASVLKNGLNFRLKFIRYNQYRFIASLMFEEEWAPSEKCDEPNKSNNFSLDWENFNDANQRSITHSKASVSDIFNYSKQSSHLSPSKNNQNNNSKEEYRISNQINKNSLINQSRNLNDISDLHGKKSEHSDFGAESFRYQKNDERGVPSYNERYNKIEQLLAQAKTHNLDEFYRQLDVQKQYSTSKNFQSYQDFKSYTRNLKQDKRHLQEQLFRAEEEKRKKSSMKNLFFGVSEQKQEKDFKKKADNFESILPTEYAQEDYFDYEEPQNKDFPKQKPTDKFDNFYEGEGLNKPEDAIQFFNFTPKGFTERKSRQSKSEFLQKLHPIREEKQTFLQKTEEDQKLGDLLKNFKKMKNNYEEMIEELKQNNQEQEKIRQDIERLKSSRMMIEIQRENLCNSHQQPKSPLSLASKPSQKRHSKFSKQQTKFNDILYVKMNEKIENLENILKLALNQIRDEKQSKDVPYIQHYEIKSNNDYNVKIQEVKKQRPTKEVAKQQPENQLGKLNFTQEEIQANLGQAKIHTYSKNTFNKQQSKKTLNSNSRNFDQKVLKKIDGVKSETEMNLPAEIWSSKYSDQPLNKIASQFILNNPEQNKYFSPLQIRLSQTRELGPTFIDQEIFRPPVKGTQHFPKEFRHQHKNLRNCLTQKSSVVYDSFDFFINAKYTKIDDFIHPLIATVRVSNKCTFDLYDVHTIVYGNQGPGIHTDPASIFSEELQKSKNYTFHVYINKSCLQSNEFNLQISYKTDSMPKKKVNIKIILPLLYLIEPLFIYEEQFEKSWESIEEQFYVRPLKLNTQILRAYEDLKLYLPFIQVPEEHESILSFGLMFKYPKSTSIFLLKMMCYMDGRCSIHLKGDQSMDRKVRQQILNALSFIFFQAP